MWTNVITHSDETKVDLKRPTSAPSRPRGVRAPWMMSLPKEEEQSVSTVPIGRVPWPEPPRSLGDRWRKTDAIALSRTIGGPHHLTSWSSWLAHLVALAAAGLLGFFLVRAPRAAPVTPTTSAQPIDNTAPAHGALRPSAPTLPSLPAPLPSLLPSPSSTRQPIEVSSLPLAPAVRVSPPARGKHGIVKQVLRPARRPADPATTTVRAPPPPRSAPSPRNAGEDGF